MFFITSGMLISTGTLYLLFAKSEIQPWNSGYTEEKEEEEEVLKTDKELLEVQIVNKKTPILKSNRNSNKI